ncbi:MAG: hypothetical protein KGL95_02835, partial [Patescibacteria group bacterium]|nr:hypothetical protein [Patescibacteria group bacterium]
YDVTNGEHVKVATWGSSAGTINNNLDANTGTITENSTKTTPPTFRFEQGEGANIGVALLAQKQSAEAASGSNTISVLPPIAIPAGTTFTVEYQNVGQGHYPFDKHPALIIKITYPDGGTATMINPYNETSFVGPGKLFFPDGLNPCIDFSTSDFASLYKANDPRALSYGVENPANVHYASGAKASAGGTEATFPVSAGQQVTSMVEGVGSATPTIFTIDGAIVVVS